MSLLIFVCVNIAETLSTFQYTVKITWQFVIILNVSNVISPPTCLQADPKLDLIFQLMLLALKKSVHIDIDIFGWGGGGDSMWEEVMGEFKI